MASCECPRISITTRAGTFCASRRDAQVCRRSWKRMRRTSALVMSSSKKRFKFRGSITVPTVEVKDQAGVDPGRS